MLSRSHFMSSLASFLVAIATIFYSQTVLADPPSRVARLSYVRGEVSFAPAGENDWVTAYLNRPLITGDRLWTDRGGRAELQLGTASVRLDQNSSFDLLTLDNRLTQIELTQGTLNLRVRRLFEDQTYEIDTPTLAFVISRPGEYRIDVDGRGRETTVTVFSGAGEAYGEAGARFRVEEDESVRFYNAGLDDYETFDLPRPDDFDRFCFERDDREDHSRSRRYVSEEIVGYSDLDEYGSWTVVHDHGNVWFPSRVRAGWAPYREGHWSWIEPWGWTWVDDAPWGFAPFHYGRWAYIDSRWGWIPGSISVRPVYAPALVAFVGGRNFRVGISSGAPIGWFPLGPREIYVPSYHVSQNYFTSVNISNTTINQVQITNVYNNYSRGNINITQINYVNRGINNAITAVPADVFTGARPVGRSAIAVDRAMAARAEVAAVASVAPSRASLAPSAPARFSPPEQALNRTVMARTTPTSSVVPFSERQAVLQQNGGRPLQSNQLQTIQNARTANSSVAPQVRVVAPNVGRAASDMPGRGQPNDRSRELLGTEERAAPRVEGRTSGNERAQPAVQENRRNPSPAIPSRSVDSERGRAEPRTTQPISPSQKTESNSGERNETRAEPGNRSLPSSTYRQPRTEARSENDNSRQNERVAPAPRISPDGINRGNEESRSNRIDSSSTRSNPQEIRREEIRRAPVNVPSSPRVQETESPRERTSLPEPRRPTPIRESQPEVRTERNYEPPARSSSSESRAERTPPPAQRQEYRAPERQTVQPRSMPQEVQRPQQVERAQPIPESRAAPASRDQGNRNKDKNKEDDDNSSSNVGRDRR